MNFREALTEGKDLTRELLGLSSGTLANEFKAKDYSKIDKIQNELVAFYQENKDKGFKNWMDVVKAFKGAITEMDKGAFTAWCKENGLMDKDSTDVPCKCIKKGLASDDKHIKKMAVFANNMNDC